MPHAPGHFLYRPPERRFCSAGHGVELPWEYDSGYNPIYGDCPKCVEDRRRARAAQRESDRVFIGEMRRGPGGSDGRVPSKSIYGPGLGHADYVDNLRRYGR